MDRAKRKQPSADEPGEGGGTGSSGAEESKGAPASDGVGSGSQQYKRARVALVKVDEASGAIVKRVESRTSKLTAPIMLLKGHKVRHGPGCAVCACVRGRARVSRCVCVPLAPVVSVPVECRTLRLRMCGEVNSAVYVRVLPSACCCLRVRGSRQAPVHCVKFDRTGEHIASGSFDKQACTLASCHVLGSTRRCQCAGAAA